MNNEENIKSNPGLLLALHSSTETFGVASLDCADLKNTWKSAVFPIGRNLSNMIFTCIEEVLPSMHWKNLRRLAVATGPGGFTGTRLSVVLARTLSEQLKCPLDGISSFELMASRMIDSLKESEKRNPFWIVKEVPRRGTIGGQYQVKQLSNMPNKFIIKELKKPHLIKNKLKDCSILIANEDVKSDINHLLEICQIRHSKNHESRWEEILPIYPTSPIDHIE